MHRTQIYLTDDQHKELKSLAKRLGKKQSELIRQAVDGLLEEKRKPTKEEIQAGFAAIAGMWADRDDIEAEMAEIRRGFDRDVWNR